MRRNIAFVLIKTRIKMDNYDMLSILQLEEAMKVVETEFEHICGVAKQEVKQPQMLMCILFVNMHILYVMK